MLQNVTVNASPIHLGCILNESTHHKHMNTTLEAAAEFGYFTRKQAIAFCKEHDASFYEAEQEIGDSVLDCVELCQWLGY